LRPSCPLNFVSTGCQWRQLPGDFPPYSTVQGTCYQWVRDGRWEVINHALVTASREKGEREARPIIHYSAIFNLLPNTPITPRRKAMTQTTKITPCVTVTQEPNCAR
jgi:transposase